MQVFKGERNRRVMKCEAEFDDGTVKFEMTLEPLTTKDIHMLAVPDMGLRSSNVFDVLSRRVKAWKGVNDEKGKPVPFDVDSLEDFLDVWEYFQACVVGLNTLSSERGQARTRKN